MSPGITSRCAAASARNSRISVESPVSKALAYDAALKAGGAELAQALARNVLLQTDAAPAEPLAAYVRATIRSLEAIGDKRVLAGELAFADASLGAQAQEQVT
jgi:hypothetical protein